MKDDVSVKIIDNFKTIDSSKYDQIDLNEILMCKLIHGYYTSK
jgi:hypothetical protein